MKRLATCLLACLSATCLAAEPAPAQLPPAAAAAIEALQKEIGKNYAAYHAAVQKASERTAKDLQKAMSDATKKGDLDTATAVKAALDELNNGKLRERLEALEQRDVDLLGDVAPPEDVLKAALSKGDWILDCGEGERYRLQFERWNREDAPSAHWTCTVQPDVAITLLSGIRLLFKSPGLSANSEFASDPKTGNLVAPNAWTIRRPNQGEDLPQALGAKDNDNVRVRGRGRRR